MSISVYIGHTGQQLALDPSVTSTVDALRSWLASQASVQPRNQILLTSQGKQVRAQTLLTENELFVFDSSWLGGKNPAAQSRESPDHVDFRPGPAPDVIADQNDLRSWEDLFRARRSWAAALFNGCSVRAKQAERYRQEKDVIQRSLSVAVASLQQHVKNAEKQYAASETWSDELMQEQAAHVNQWESNLDSLRSVPGRVDFLRFIQPVGATSTSRRLSQQANMVTLQGFVDVAGVRKAAGHAKSTLNGFAAKIAKMREDLDSATNNSDHLLQAVDQINNPSMAESASEPAQLTDEIGMVVKKMASDLEHVESLPRTQQSVSQASKMALLHTRNYLPNLGDYCAEMNDLAHRNQQQKDSAADVALGHMRTLSSIESQLATLYAEIKQLEMPEDQQEAFVTLSTVSRLPSVYGQLLVESVRRREWVAKMKRDSATLAEEVATYQEEEEKRRKKWMRTVEDVVSPDALQNRVLGIELNLQNEGDSWPMTTREELHDYLRTLLDVYGEGPVTNEIDQAIKDLDKPTRKQIKHARAFKNGSIHEAAFGDTSLLLRGDDQTKTLRETNVRLEEDLRAQRSRVRKLEDLLYRQTHMGRASTGDMFAAPNETTPQQRPGTSPRTITAPSPMDDLSRVNSLTRPRGLSAAQVPNHEERRLTKRVVELEAELQSYKTEAASRKNSDVEAQKQVEEAMSTKRDLMQNMEAQQREFADERRNLERELSETKERIEELENDLERIIGSRDGADDEIARLKEDAAGHAARAATAQDARAIVERRLEQAELAQNRAEEEVQKLRLELEKRREAEMEPLQLLTTAHTLLARDTESPNGLLELAIALEEVTRKSALHAKDLEEAVAFAKSENESLWSSNERQKKELASHAEQIAQAENQINTVREKLDAEAAKGKAFEEQLNQEQEQLQVLRNKFAEGETGSEVLRQQAATEEAKARSLATELAEAKSHINSLDVELTRVLKRQSSDHATADDATERLRQRAERAKDVSQKLHSQNVRLGRLLERLGLAVSYQDDTMVIERASKLAASTVMYDAPGVPGRKASLDAPAARPPLHTEPDAPLEPRLLHWADAPTADDELARYSAFAAHLARFDLDVFADAVTKRVKDFEYTAKKYSKEAKEGSKRADAYKERAQRLRAEAHSKLAVRDFKDGDLALFLPTRGGQAKGAWAAFNVGCPHYFLAEREGMRLPARDFIVARIQRVEQKVVDLGQARPPRDAARSIDSRTSSLAVEDDNPFDLSDGLTWWMVHAVEERAGATTTTAPGSGPGAPTTPGLGKSTVAAANVDAKGSIRIAKRGARPDEASRHLNKSLDSRRSSSTSKKGAGAPTSAAQSPGGAGPGDGLRPPSLVGEGAGMTAAAATRGGNSGLGIRAPSPERSLSPRVEQRPQQQQQQQQQQHMQTQDQQTSTTRLEDDEAGHLSFARPEVVRTRSGEDGDRRADSPSKSVRSLQRHLEPGAGGNGKTNLASSGSAAKGKGWESLWSAEFSVESGPTKGEKR